MKTKTISLTDKQFALLLRSVTVASSIYGIMGDFVDDEYKKISNDIDEVEKMLCSRVYEFGLGKATQKYEGSYVIDLESEWYKKVFDEIMDYDDHVTYSNLANKLGWRDFEQTYSQEEIRKMADKTGYLGVPLYNFEKKYWDEFDRHEYNRLEIVETIYGDKIDTNI